MRKTKSASDTNREKELRLEIMNCINSLSYKDLCSVNAKIRSIFQENVSEQAVFQNPFSQGLQLFL